MKIAISGYGKMGKTIERLALKRGHEISYKINSGNIGDWDKINSSNTDVVIEFSIPKSIVDNVKKCFDRNIPIVVGTTGWYDQLDRIKAETESNNKTLIYGSNFSIGVNLFFKLNKYLANMMREFPAYNPSVSETHHVHKLDAPSGTAITLANGIISEHPSFKQWVSGKAQDDKSLSVVSHRIDEIPGTHEISYGSEEDEIQIIHRAKSRDGFALGSIIAAEWVQHKKGFYNISDIL